MSQIVLVPPHNQAHHHNHSHKRGFLEGLVVLLSGSHPHCAVLQHGQVCEVSIEDLKMHGVLVDGHLDGLFQAAHHIRCLLLCRVTSGYRELVEL